MKLKCHKGKLGNCDTEKIQYIDIETKISIILNISNFANEKAKFC